MVHNSIPVSVALADRSRREWEEGSSELARLGLIARVNDEPRPEEYGFDRNVAPGGRKDRAAAEVVDDLSPAQPVDANACLAFLLGAAMTAAMTFILG